MKMNDIQTPDDLDLYVSTMNVYGGIGINTVKKPMLDLSIRYTIIIPEHTSNGKFTVRLLRDAKIDGDIIYVDSHRNMVGHIYHVNTDTKNRIDITRCQIFTNINDADTFRKILEKFGELSYSIIYTNMEIIKHLQAQ